MLFAKPLGQFESILDTRRAFLYSFRQGKKTEFKKKNKQSENSDRIAFQLRLLKTYMWFMRKISVSAFCEQNSFMHADDSFTKCHGNQQANILLVSEVRWTLVTREKPGQSIDERSHFVLIFAVRIFWIIYGHCMQKTPRITTKFISIQWTV